MLLIIDKCLMAVELSPKERNPNITPQIRTPWKRGRIILVVVCKSTFWTELYDFKIVALLFVSYFKGGGLKINLEDI
jgi:hypothetical protein